MRYNIISDEDHHQARVQEFVRGGQNLKAFFFNFSGGGGAAQKIDEKMIFSTKKVAKYR